MSLFNTRMAEPFRKDPNYRKDSNIRYPPFCNVCFERYFYDYIEKAYAEGRVEKWVYDRYIPVLWNEIQISAIYDETMATRRRDADNEYLWTLWQQVHDLPKNEIFFTVVQHDDGITFSCKPENLVTFAMGGTGHVPVPLTYDVIPDIDRYKATPKTTFCSFVGSLTHPCREKMVEVLKDKDDVIIQTTEWTNQISVANQTNYLEVMSKSRFTLAPRGYGKTSFRLYEALRMGSIPVYIHTIVWLPYQGLVDWSKMIVMVHADEIDTLYDRLSAITDEQVAEMLAYYKTVEHLFEYDGICDYILTMAANIQWESRVSEQSS